MIEELKHRWMEAIMKYKDPIPECHSRKATEQEIWKTFSSKQNHVIQVIYPRQGFSFGEEKEEQRENLFSEQAS